MGFAHSENTLANNLRASSLLAQKPPDIKDNHHTKTLPPVLIFPHPASTLINDLEALSGPNPGDCDQGEDEDSSNDALERSRNQSCL